MHRNYIALRFKRPKVVSLTSGVVGAFPGAGETL